MNFKHLKHIKTFTKLLWLCRVEQSKSVLLSANFMVHFYDVLTSFIWVGSRVHSQEAAASCIGIRDHLYKHLVACRNKGSWPECPTEAAETLSLGMATINIHIIVAAQVVTL